jgi:uncharacterized Zn finger protein (UPF0148 family)
MKQNELESKIHEIKEVLNERRDEVARTKISEAEKQELLSIQERVENLLEGLNKLNSEEEEQHFIQRVDSLIHEIRQSPT